MARYNHPIIDIHTHIFPDVIAQKASDSIGSFYDLKMRHDGTLSELIRCMAEAGISQSCVHSVAITPKSMNSINRYISESVTEYSGKLIGFAAIHPDAEDIGNVVDEILSLPFAGFKIHPDMQRFALDSQKAMDMFSAIEGRLPIIIHTGDPRYSYSNPDQMKKVLDAFPKLTCVCAHLGGWGKWDEAWKTLSKYENVYVDTSSSLYAMTPETAVSVIRHYESGHVLFGTDYPMWNPEQELKRFIELPLTDKEKDMILFENPAAFLNQ